MGSGYESHPTDVSFTFECMISHPHHLEIPFDMFILFLLCFQCSVDDYADFSATIVNTGNLIHDGDTVG